jgi:hypothetical protein
MQTCLFEAPHPQPLSPKRGEGSQSKDAAFRDKIVGRRAKAFRRPTQPTSRRNCGRLDKPRRRSRDSNSLRSETPMRFQQASPTPIVFFFTSCCEVRKPKPWLPSPPVHSELRRGALRGRRAGMREQSGLLRFDFALVNQKALPALTLDPPSWEGEDKLMQTNSLKTARPTRGGDFVDANSR